MASGADGDNEERVETRRLTGTQSDGIQYNTIQCFCSYKVHDFILLFRCHLVMDFDIRQREGSYYVLKMDQFASSMLVLLSWMPV
jgi:hypothetical protein